MERWLGVIGEYNRIIRHRAGRLHGNADALSRRPCNNCKHCENKESNHSEMKEIVRIRFMANPEGEQINELGAWVEGWPLEHCMGWDNPFGLWFGFKSCGLGLGCCLVD